MDTEHDGAAATLLLPDCRPAGFIADLGDRVCEELASLGHDIREVTTTGRRLVRIEIAGAQIVVAYCGAPLTAREYRHCLRPANRNRFSDEAAMAQLSVHRACIIVTSRARPTLAGFPPPSPREIELLVHQIIARIGAEIEMGLVLWARTGHLYTAPEFAAVIARAEAVRPTLPLRPIRTPEERTPRPVLYQPAGGAAANLAEASATWGDAFADAATAQDGPHEAAADPRTTARGVFEQGLMDIVSLHERLDDTLARVRPGAPPVRTWAPPESFIHRRRRRQRNVGEDANAHMPPPPEVRVPPQDDIANTIPDLPGTNRGQAARIRAALYPEGRPDMIGPKAQPLQHRLAIYTMNTTLLVIAMPVGAAMLTYNALGRESLTATARAMAITGVGLFYAKLPLAQQLVSMIL